MNFGDTWLSSRRSYPNLPGSWFCHSYCHRLREDPTLQVLETSPHLKRWENLRVHGHGAGYPKWWAFEKVVLALDMAHFLVSIRSIFWGFWRTRPIRQRSKKTKEKGGQDLGKKNKLLVGLHCLSKKILHQLYSRYFISLCTRLYIYIYIRRCRISSINSSNYIRVVRGSYDPLKHHCKHVHRFPLMHRLVQAPHWGDV